MTSFFLTIFLKSGGEIIMSNCNNCGPYGNQIVIKIIKNMSLWIIKNSNILHIIIRIIYKKKYMEY